MLLSTRMHYNNLFFEGILVSLQKGSYLNEPDHHYRSEKKTQTNKKHQTGTTQVFFPG